MTNTILPEILKSGEESAKAVSIPEKYNITYSELRSVVSEISTKLNEFGTINEKPIVIVLKNNAEFIISFLGVTSTNAIAAPLNPEFTEEELRFYLDDIQPSLVITNNGHKVVKEAELKNIPSKYIHLPADLDENSLIEYGVKLDSDYPRPIVDLSTTRERALDAFQKLPKST